MGKRLAEPRPDVADSVDYVLALVRERGGRVTSPKRLLLEELFARRDYLTAEELTEHLQGRIPDVATSTVYRNLEDLQRLGVVVHAHLGHGPATYQLASHAHAHFVCEECGSTVDVPDELFEELARTARRRLKFVIDPRHFAILGRCCDCPVAIPPAE